MAARKRTAPAASKKKNKNNNDDSLGELPEGLSDSEDSLLLPMKKNNKNDNEEKTPKANRKRKTASCSPSSSLKSGAISNSEGEDLSRDGEKIRATTRKMPL